MMFTDLPPDLESEILSKVPATSLGQLRFTCKRWYALCKDPRFIKKMGKTATQVIVKKDYSVHSVIINPHGGIYNSFDPLIKLTGKLKSLKELKDITIYEILHCDGLLLCTVMSKNTKYVVWNPCTGQTRCIQHGKGCSKYVLGYDKFCESYKILTFKYYLVTAPELYEFNSDSWTVLLDDVTPFIRSSAVNLKGNTYWFASDTEYPPFVKFVLRFDFTRERFERLSLPFQSDYVDENVDLLVVREEKLALLYENVEIAPFDEMKVWITTKIDDEAKDLSWSIFLVVDLGKFGTGMTSVESFLVDEENKMVVCCCLDKIYIVGEDIYKEGYKGLFSMMTPLVMSYVPSLVQIQQPKSNLGGKRKR